MMRLYHDLRAPNPRRVRMFLAEKGLTDQVELVEVSIATHANMTPAFLDKNPLGLVPVLELPDGRTLRESMAICRYLEELHPQPSLFGADAWSRAQIEQWNRHAEFELMATISQANRHLNKFWAGKVRQVAEVGQDMKELAARRFDWFDGELSRHPYLAGDRYTIADVALYSYTHLAEQSEFDLKPFPALRDWLARVAAEPRHVAMDYRREALEVAAE